MLLLIDAGNTRIKWALTTTGSHTAPGEWVGSGALAHAQMDTLKAAWSAHAITRVVAANVAGAAVGAALQAMLYPLPVTWFASVAEIDGMRNGYRDPSRLGCDRFAAALGARALAPGQRLIVATCGTATTIDAISAEGHFIGGMIAPGLGIMAASLARNTAQLPQVEPGATLSAGFADNTDDAILAGCLAAQAGAIERACAQHDAQACILSGGAAPYITEVLAVAHRMVDNIVLIGLQRAALVSDSTTG